MANGYFGGGTGTELDPFLVEDADDLSAIRNTNREDSTSNYDIFFKQVSDIDLSGINWIPIDFPQSESNDFYDGVRSDSITNFSVNYNGNNFTINNMSIKFENHTKEFPSYIGLFGNCQTFRGRLYNVTLIDFDIDVTITGYYFPRTYFLIGGLAGGLYLSHDCMVKNGNIRVMTSDLRYSTLAVGSFAGGAPGVTSTLKCGVENCSIETNISGTDEISSVGLFMGIGRVARYDYSYSVKDCYATGKLLGYADRIGGFIGMSNNGTLYNCYCAVDMSGIALNREGSIVAPMLNDKSLNGYVKNSAQRCYYDADIAGIPHLGLGEPRTTTQMKKRSNFVNWDFNSIWDIFENQTYPFFKSRQSIKRYKMKSMPFPIDFRKMTVN